MKRFSIRAVVGIFFTSVLLMAILVFPAYAQATRTWVSGVGDDVNPCSRTAPCKTFAGAISKTANNGVINAIDPGGFGAVTITKSITIEGGHSMAGILVSGGPGITVNGAGIKVRLRNLDIEGVGAGTDGIKFLQGASLTVENSEIYGFAGRGVFVGGGSAGIGRAVFKDVVSTDNAAGAFLFSQTTAGKYKASIVSSAMTSSPFGVRAESNTEVSVKDSVAVGNTNNGFVAITTSAAPAVLNLNNVEATNNTNGTSGAGIQSNQAAGSTSTVRISNSTSWGNDVGLLSIGGGAIISAKNNTVDGNTTNGAPTATIAQV